MTFTLGFAGVWMFNGMTKGFLDVSVELPKVQSENVLVVFPKKCDEIYGCGSYGGRRIDIQYKKPPTLEPKK
ncbi:MAG: hypothetical protein ACR2N3_08930 [Pyrinomonadaceae bacterium]